MNRGPRMRRDARRVLFAALTLLFAALCCGAARVDAADLERSVKAAFLYKFAGYVEWPAAAFAAPAAPLVIGVAGGDDIAAELLQIVPGRNVDQHPVAVRRVKEGDPLDGLQILFVGADQPRGGALIRAAQQHPVLVVTEAESGMPPGSALNFVLSGGKVRFMAAPEAAERNGLKLSSRLLGVALARGSAP